MNHTEFRNYVINKMIEKFHIDEFSAQKLYRYAKMKDLFVYDSEWVLHYSIDYWADEIYKSQSHDFAEDLIEM